MREKRAIIDSVLDGVGEPLATFISRYYPYSTDPALAPFLALLERDITARPEALVPLTPDLVARMTAATEGVEADPDAPIEGEVAL